MALNEATFFYWQHRKNNRRDQPQIWQNQPLNDYEFVFCWHDYD
jgi:hypothetical protein